MGRSAASRSADSRFDPGEIAIAAGIASRDATGAVVFAPPAAVQVQRQESAPAPAAPAPPVPASPAAAPVAPVTVPAPAVPGATTAPDVAAMADELYERIERRLRTDLLLERERRGMLADP